MLATSKSKTAGNGKGISGAITKIMGSKHVLQKGGGHV